MICCVFLLLSGLRLLSRPFSSLGLPLQPRQPHLSWTMTCAPPSAEIVSSPNEIEMEPGIPPRPHERFLTIASTKPNAQIGAPKGKTIGSNCQCDAECDFRIKESFCDVGRCSCLPGFKGFTGALECSKLRIGDRCGSDLDCSLAIANSICDNSGFCACPTGFAVTRNGCEELELGSRCTESEDCSTAVANSECTGNRCVCQTDFVETADGECRGCNVDEVLFPQGASSASCYYASEDDQNWQAARDICQARGMDLVSIHNSEEESFVADLFSPSVTFWIGLNDQEVDKVYVWSDGTPLSYTNWDNPSDPSEGAGEDCVRWYAENAEWRDTGCGSGSSYPFVCKGDLVVQRRRRYIWRRP